MNLARRAVCTLAIVGFLACPAVSSAGPLTLSIAGGLVTLSAQDVPLRQILAEWERLGGMRIINRERVPGTLVTIALTNVTEEKAIETLLRPIAGFMAVERTDGSAGASVYARILIMPGSAAPAFASSGASASSGAGRQVGGRPTAPQVQRRVLADGRVISFIDNPNRPGDMTIVDDSDDQGDDPGAQTPMMRPPFGAPGRLGQGPGTMPGGGMPGGDPDQNEDQPAPVQAPSATPTMPARTLPTPGVLPAVSPGPGQPPRPPGPPKPPGD